MNEIEFSVNVVGFVILLARSAPEARDLALALALLKCDDPAVDIGGGWGTGPAVKLSAEDPAWKKYAGVAVGKRNLYRVPLLFEGTAVVTAEDEKSARALLDGRLDTICGTRQNPDFCFEPFEDRNVPEKYMDLYGDLKVTGVIQIAAA